jgi:3-isopropylmalate/(R)-2-methylmalate dehydratase large subunit
MSQAPNHHRKSVGRHVVANARRAGSAVIDLHLVHEVTSPQAFAGLRERGLKVRRPDLTVATTDHSTHHPPAVCRSGPDGGGAGRAARGELHRVRHSVLRLHSENQGIVHVIGPEQGFTQPGMTVVCGDSHTATHGAFGALAFGIGTSEVEHVLATQCLLQRKSKTFEVNVEGTLKPGVTAKDIILALIARSASAAAPAACSSTRGSDHPRASMEERMTVCNMSIEGGARAG